MSTAFMASSPSLSGKARKYGFHYRRIALVELDPGQKTRPAMISERARGVRRIIEENTIYIGKTKRSHGYRELMRMRATADVIFD